MNWLWVISLAALYQSQGRYREVVAYLARGLSGLLFYRQEEQNVLKCQE